jgi:hypothetical protein
MVGEAMTGVLLVSFERGKKKKRSSTPPRCELRVGKKKGASREKKVA